MLHKIACDMYGYSGLNGAAAIEELMAYHNRDFNMAITADVEETEAYFLDKYGSGETYYFALHDITRAWKL